MRHISISSKNGPGRGILSICLLAGSLTAFELQAHGAEIHADPGIAVEIDDSTGRPPLPIDVKGAFNLIDHNGNSVSEKDFAGKHMLVFFGYASCKNMCSISLSRIGGALDILGESASKLSPIIITVDPQRDTPKVLKAELPKYHPQLIGLTGGARQLAEVYSNFNQKPVSVGNDWNHDPIISHSSYIYLLDQKGRLATLFPPILNPQSMADIIKKYLGQLS